MGGNGVKGATNNGLVWWLAIMAGLQTFVAGGMLSGVVGAQWAGMAGLIVASLNASTAAYVAATKPVSNDTAERAAIVREVIQHVGSPDRKD